MQMIWKENHKDFAGWKKVDDYHVTTFFVGKDEDKTDHELYKNFQNQIEV